MNKVDLNPITYVSHSVNRFSLAAFWERPIAKELVAF